MAAALGPASGHTRERLADGPDERPIREQILELARSGEQGLAKILPSVLVLQAAGIDPSEVYRIAGEPTFKVTHVALVSWLRRAQRRGLLRKHDSEALAVAISGILAVRALRRAVFGETGDRLTTERYLAASIDVLLEGIQPQPQTHGVM